MATVVVTSIPPIFFTERRDKRMDEIKRATGRIIKVSKQGWGFISSKQIEFTRIFFHWTALQQNTTPFLQLRTGMWAEFTPMEIPGKGWRAVHVRIIEREKEKEDTNEMSTLSE